MRGATGAGSPRGAVEGFARRPRRVGHKVFAHQRQLALEGAPVRQLHVPVLEVVHVALDRAGQLPHAPSRVRGQLPLRPPAARPVWSAA